MDTDDAVGGDSATKWTTDRGNISVGDNHAGKTFFNHCTAVYHMASVSEAALCINVNVNVVYAFKQKVLRGLSSLSVCVSVRLTWSVCPMAAPDSKTKKNNRNSTIGGKYVAYVTSN